MNTDAYRSERLTGGHVLLSWTTATAIYVQLYREVCANGPEDKGEILGTRELPLAASQDDRMRAQVELLKRLPAECEAM